MNLKNTKIYLLAVIGMVAGTAQSATVETVPTKVVLIQSYNQFGGGDVVLKVENPVSDCLNGYWIAPSDPGFKTNLALAVAASQTKATVVISGLTDQLWPGSQGKYCKIYSIDLH